MLSYPTLEEGIPELARSISETGPSFPTEDDHPKVRIVEKEFGLLEEQSFEKIKGTRTNLRTVDGRIEYSTENDIAVKVGSFIETLVDALRLTGEVKVSSEVGVFKLRPDLWVISRQTMPIGFIEVKKPDIVHKESDDEDDENDEVTEDHAPKRRPSCLLQKDEEDSNDDEEQTYISAMEHPNVLGELYDFMKHLPNFYGVYPAFGTIMNAWRVAWLPNADTDTLAAQTETIDDSRGKRGR